MIEMRVLVMVMLVNVTSKAMTREWIVRRRMDLVRRMMIVHIMMMRINRVMMMMMMLLKHMFCV